MAPVVRLSLRMAAWLAAGAWAFMVPPLGAPWANNASQHYSVGLWLVYDANAQNYFATRHGFALLPDSTELVEQYDYLCEWYETSGSTRSEPWCEAGAVAARVFSCLTLFLLVPPSLFIALRWHYKVRQGRALQAAYVMFAAAWSMTFALVSWDEGFVEAINDAACAADGTCVTLHAGFITLAMAAGCAFACSILLWMLGRQNELAWNVDFARAAKVGNMTTLMDILEADNPEFDLNVEGDEGMNALHWAAANDHQQVLVTLSKHGVDLDRRDRWGWTAVHWAARNGHTDMIEELLQHGADADLADESGVTPLMLCVASNCTDGLKALIRRAVNCDAATVRGETALLLCADRGIQRRNMATTLINAGASVAVANAQGDTVLHMAACSGDDRLVRMALQVGGEGLVYRRNRDGATPSDEARVRGQAETLDAITKFVRKQRREERRAAREEEKIRAFRAANAAAIVAAQEAEMASIGL